MNRRFEMEMSTEYRMGMIAAFALTLLSMLLPVASVSVLGTKIRVAVIDIFRTTKLEKIGLSMGMQGTLIYLRIFLIFSIALLIGGLLCYVLNWRSRVKEGLVIWLLLSVRGLFSTLFITLLSVTFVASVLRSDVRIGLGTVIGFISTQYLFFRPLIYLCTCQPSVMERVNLKMEPPLLQKPANQQQPLRQPELPKQPLTVPGRETRGELYGLSGIYKDQVIPLRAGERLVMGRSAQESNLIVNAPKVSRKHCELSYDRAQGTFMLYDYSSNGTYLGNGTCCGKETVLRAGGTFYLGDRNNLFQVR